MATGIETARLLQVIAVLERRAGLSFAGQDVYVSVAGGMRVLEPAVDLPLALALGSAVCNVALPLDLASFGEVGLTGQVRPVAQSAARLREAARLGMRRVLAAAPASLASGESAGLSRVATVAEALGVLQ